ncbi:MAG: NfeD family protein [Luteolibacter sp.]|uniref:NfeD family protein n=1 Tax=Luteolibacter sp. TaxID=1962973 RepID=UPI003264DA87
MTALILFFAVGILLIAAEVVVPGGVLGVLGALLMFGGCVRAFMDFGSIGGLIAVITAFTLGGLVLYFEFSYLPKTKWGKRAFLTAQVTGVTAAVGKEAVELVGKSAEALTLLSPSGYVRVDGERYEAFCQSGQAPVGSILEIIGADNFRLIVTQRSKI